MSLPQTYDKNFLIFQENDLDSEGSEEARSGRGLRSSLLVEIHGLQREEQVYFTNQEYYRRLEELKSNHLRNMADLERMYISQAKEGRGGGDDGELQRWRDKQEKQFFRWDTLKRTYHAKNTFFSL